MGRATLLMIPLIAGLAIPAAAAAQTGPSVASVLAGPASGPLTAPPPRSVEVSLGESDGTATFSVGASRVTGDGSMLDWRISATTPADAKAATTVLSLAGLPDATTFGLHVSGVSGAVGLPDFDDPFIKSLCARMNQARLAKKAGAKDDPGDCQSNDIGQYLSQKDLAQFQRAIVPQGARMFFWGLDSQVGFHDFDYLDTATAAKATVRHTAWSVSGRGAIYFPREEFLVGGRIDYQRDYAAQDAGALCPSTGGPILSCVTGPLGAPTLRERLTISAEVRHSFGPLAVAPSVIYDVKNKVTGIDVPIYLVSGAQNDFTGGLRVGWRSDTRNVTAGVFVSKNFSMFDF